MKPGRPIAFAMSLLKWDRRRAILAIAGIGFSYFLMVFQGGLFVGFLQAAGHVINVSKADIWVTGALTPCLEFASPIRENVASELSAVPGVSRTARALVGFVPWIGPKGERRSVTIFGADALPGSRIPWDDGHSSWRPRYVKVDESALGNLGIDASPVDVQVAGSPAILAETTSGFGSFLGAPYAFTSYADAHDWLRIPPNKTMFVLIQVMPKSDVESIARLINDRYPELQAMTSAEFARSSGAYWMEQTGAGGGIALAGLLGVLIGALITSQIMYAMTVDRLEDFATVAAIGAPMSFATRVVTGIAIIIAATGVMAGLIILWPIAVFTRQFVVAWIAIPWWLVILCAALTIGVALVATRSSLRLLRGVDLARVFRG